MSQPPKVEKVTNATKKVMVTNDPTVAAYAKVNLEPSSGKQQKQSPPQRQSGQPPRQGQAPRQNTLQRTRMRDPNNPDRFLEEDDFEEDNAFTDQEFSSEGSEFSQQKFKEEQAYAENLENSGGKGASGSSAGGQGGKHQHNRQAIAQLEEFLESDPVSDEQKRHMDAFLQKMIFQCRDGMNEFPFENPVHQSLGKSYNLCQHALSALVRDDMKTVKMLLKKIAPRKKGA